MPCKDCHYFSEHQCHRYPPNRDWKFARTNPAGWCGEFKAKTSHNTPIESCAFCGAAPPDDDGATDKGSRDTPIRNLVRSLESLRGTGGTLHVDEPGNEDIVTGKWVGLDTIELFVAKYKRKARSVDSPGLSGSHD